MEKSTPEGSAVRSLSGIPDEFRQTVAALLGKLEADLTPLNYEAASVILGMEQMLMLRDSLTATAWQRVAYHERTEAEAWAKYREVKALLRRSLQLPRPWIDGGIGWNEWNDLFEEIEKAIAVGDAK